MCRHGWTLSNNTHFQLCHLSVSGLCTELFNPLLRKRQYVVRWHVASAAGTCACSPCRSDCWGCKPDLAVSSTEPSVCTELCMAIATQGGGLGELSQRSVLEILKTDGKGGNYCL